MSKIQVDLRNFQSISKAELEFVQGINVIVGQSNSGKSAIIRAIKGAILNPKGSQKFIKHGEDKLLVSIKYLDNDINWTRTNKESKYEVNGEKYLKVGNSNLTKIIDKSGFVLDENDQLMNVEGELELPFPFDKGPTDLFKLFEKSIFCVSDSALILKTIKADEDNINKDKATAKYELERFNNKLKALSSLQEEIDLNKIKKSKADLESKFFELEKLQDKYGKVVEGYNAGKKLKEVKEEITPFDINSYIKLLEDINKLENINKLADVLKQEKEEVNTCVDFSKYNKLVQDYETLINTYKILSANKETKEEVSNVSDIEKYVKLVKDYKTYCNVIKRYKQVNSDLEANKKTIANLKAEMNNFKVCPLCGQEIKEK